MANSALAQAIQCAISSLSSRKGLPRVVQGRPGALGDRLEIRKWLIDGYEM